MWFSDQTCSSSDDSSSLSNYPTQNHQCVATIKNQNTYTSSLLLAGKYLFTGSCDRELRSWECKGMATCSSQSFESDDNINNAVYAGKGAIKALVASEDKIITAHQDHKIRVWRLEKQSIDNREQRFTQLATLPTFTDRAMRLLVPKNHVRIRRHKKLTWVHHADTVSALVLSNDESLLYSVSWDRSLKVWRTADFKCLESVADAHDDAINAIALSSDDHVFTGSSDNKIKVWKQRKIDEGGHNKHVLVAALEQHRGGVNALAMSKDGSVLYSGSSDKSILVWACDEGCDSMTVVAKLRGHTKPVLCLDAVSELVCSGSADNTVRIWRSYSCLAVLEGHKGPVKCITMATDQSSNNHLSMTCRCILYTVLVLIVILRRGRYFFPSSKKYLIISDLSDAFFRGKRISFGYS